MQLNIKSLRAETILGIYHHEQYTPREVILHLRLIIPTPVEDRIHATVDYDKIEKCLRDYLRENSFELLETLAEKALDQLAQFPHIEAAELEIEKPGALKHSDMVSVTAMRRYR